uniref:Uncharacterized protein n=1 Tax=Rousettus aegyptiacus TaxID=9407 RepID=A0A7J8B7S1_ROUAE|nr:hypothetical protein HJG63_010049 [Rousettus aegyptiacus]
MMDVPDGCGQTSQHFFSDSDPGTTVADSRRSTRLCLYVRLIFHFYLVRGGEKSRPRGCWAKCTEWDHALQARCFSLEVESAAPPFPCLLNGWGMCFASVRFLKRAPQASSCFSPPPRLGPRKVFRVAKDG